METPNEQALLKAASAGFIQTLTNRGVDQESAVKAAAAYLGNAEGKGGLLEKRAKNMQLAHDGVAGMIAALRASQR